MTIKYRITKDDDDWYRVLLWNGTSWSYLSGSYDLNTAKKKALKEIAKVEPIIIEEAAIGELRTKGWWEPLFKLFHGGVK